MGAAFQSRFHVNWLSEIYQPHMFPGGELYRVSCFDMGRGKGLCFVEGYNTTHHNPKKYFDSVADINVWELSPCNATDFINPLRMGNYAKYSGDAAGHVLVQGSLKDTFCIFEAWLFSIRETTIYKAMFRCRMCPSCRQGSKLLTSDDWCFEL